MPLVSITRFRARSIWFVPFLMVYSQRSIAQLRKATGCLSMALLQDKNLAFWTMTIWTDETSMKAYITSGPHRKAMPRLASWADEASVVHWHQDHADRPDWYEAARRMKADGRPSKLRQPGPHHANMSFPNPHTSADTLFEKIGHR